MSSSKDTIVRSSRLQKVALVAFLLVAACIWVVASGSKTANAQALSGDELVGMSDEVIIDASATTISADEKLALGTEEVPGEMKKSEKRTTVSTVKDDSKKSDPKSSGSSASLDVAAASIVKSTGSSTSTSAVTTTKKSDKGGSWSKAKCSWYGVSDNGGSQTASGKKLTDDCMFVAHKTLPFGTKVQFRFNGKTVTGVVQDRGPFIKGRVFDLGPGVAKALGFDGVHTVEYRIL